MKVKKTSPAIFFVLSMLLFTLGGVLLFALPQRTYSENENRYLTTFQPPAVSSFLDTSMQKNLTDGASDQFAGRDLWMKFATTLQRSVGFQDLGGVYFGKDGYYFERVLESDLSKTRYSNNLRYMEQFTHSYQTDVCFMPVPSKSSILTDLLPANAVIYQADKLYHQAGQILQQTVLSDLRSLFEQEKQNSQLYFKTDHHWTMDGAYQAYTAWSEMHDRMAAPLAEFVPKCVSDTFFGTLYSKAPDFHAQPDQFFLPTKIPQAAVTIDGKSQDLIYDRTKLDTKDKYAVYFGGNFGRIDIELKNSRNHKKLLVIKDSFANSLIPFLMADYAQITLIDFRYFNKPVSKLIREIQPDETLILYEISNFAQDTNFFKILK